MNKISSPPIGHYKPRWELVEKNSFIMPNYKPQTSNSGFMMKRRVNISQMKICPHVMKVLEPKSTSALSFRGSPNATTRTPMVPKRVMSMMGPRVPDRSKERSQSSSIEKGKKSREYSNSPSDYQGDYNGANSYFKN